MKGYDLSPNDYFEQYNKNIESLKNRPEIVEFDKLCYELFHSNEQGKVFMEFVKERFLEDALASPGDQNFQISCMYYEGFKEAFRMLKRNIVAHKQRIEADKEK